MKGKGTTTNLAEITQFIYNNITESQVDVIYFDFSKAFDQTRHDLLAVKLCKLSTTYNFFKIIMKFITNRTYILRIDNVPTEYILIPKSSVPQGLHFGPILYILFTNDMNLEDSLCFADDTKIFAKIRSIENRNLLQERILELQNWAEINFLTLNPIKTYHVSYGKKIINSCYFLQGTEKVHQVRDLRIIFDEEFTFKPHVQNIARIYRRSAELLKILKNESRTTLTEEIEPYIIRRERPSRIPNLFSPFNSVPNKSSAYIIMNSMKYQQRNINLSLSTITNKLKIKKFNN